MSISPNNPSDSVSLSPVRDVHTIPPRTVFREDTYWIEGHAKRDDIKDDLLTKRNIIPLSKEEEEDLEDDIQIITASLRKLKRRIKVHEVQEEVGKKIYNAFSDNPSLVMVLGLGMTQSGKTGVMVSTLKEFTTGNTILKFFFDAFSRKFKIFTS